MTAGQTDLTLIELSELLLRINPNTIIAQLTSRGCIISPKTGWNPLSGGREYIQCSVDSVQINGLYSKLIVEISRTSKESKHARVDGFILYPGNLSNSVWIEGIRKILSEEFEMPSASRDVVEVYERGSIEQSILFPGSATEPARLLMHRRSLIRHRD